MRYLIIGNGFLGNRLKEELEDSKLFDRKVESVKDVERAIEENSAEIVINCAGKTGKPNVDACENEKEETFFGNVNVPFFIAEACRNKNVKMVHMSTGCIYEGDENFTEEDEPNFKDSVYSRTKLIAEKMLKAYDVLQIRLRIPIDDRSNDRNLIDKLLAYVKKGNKILIAENSITPVPFLLKAISELVNKDARGVFNVVGKGGITHDKILNVYKEISGEDLQYETITSSELDKITKARRSNCTLSTGKLESFGISVPDVEEAVRTCIASYLKKTDKALS